MTHDRTFPGRLRTIRRRAVCRLREPHQSHERLAAEAGLGFTFVVKVERGRAAVTVDSVAALSRALGVPLSDFFEPLTARSRSEVPGAGGA